MMTWTRASHFVRWADEDLRARSILPLLVRRLALGVLPSEAIVEFPALEQVKRRGFDGIVEVKIGNQFVPAGKSAWEMGVNADPKKKAEADYKTRTEQIHANVRRETTFVFVTPRDWQKDKREEWAEEKRTLRKWKDVWALDSNDLEHWIDRCYAVDCWFSEIDGRRPPGVFDLSNRWQSVSRIGEHPFSFELPLISREAEGAQILSFVESVAGSCLLKTASSDEGIDFLAAVVANPANHSPRLERLIVAENHGAYRHLANSHEPLILVAKSPVALGTEDIAEAVANGHHVILIGNASVTSSSTVIDLPRQRVGRVASALIECGYDNATSHAASQASAGSFASLKRRLAVHPLSSLPSWCEPDAASELLPYVLLGQWRHVDPTPAEENFISDPPLDLEVLEGFIGEQRPKIEATLARWTHCDEPIFLRLGDTVAISSREDAWSFIGGAITPELLRRFRDQLTFILQEDDPALSLDPDQRAMASVLGRTPVISSELRLGLIEALPLMVCVQTANPPAFNIDFASEVRMILDELLPRDATWERWATLDGSLSLIAEADADFLLQRIELDLRSGSQQIPTLFSNGDNAFTGRVLHCGLLSALETIAWCPRHLARVTRILVDLVRIEESLPNKFGNAPSRSLRLIFLSWLPRTTADVKRRLNVLKGLAERNTDACWRLLLSVLPTGLEESANDTALPRWRDWSSGWSDDQCNREYHEYASGLVGLAVDLADGAPDRWSEIIELIVRMGGQPCEEAIQRIEALDAIDTNHSGTPVLWETLRDLISRHERDSRSQDEEVSDVIDRLTVIRDRIEPDDPVTLSRWLFDYQPQLPGIDISGRYDEYTRNLAARQLETLQEIIDRYGWQGCTRLAEAAENSFVIGWTLGKHDLLSPEDIELFEPQSWGDPKLALLLSEYVAGAYHTAQIGFLDRLNLNDRDPIAASAVLCAVNPDRDLWNWIDSSLPPAIGDAYWNRIRIRIDVSNPTDIRFGVNRLLGASRPFSAAKLLDGIGDRSTLEIELVFRVLEAGLSSENDEDATRVDAHTIQRLILHLQQHGCDAALRLGRLEWGYLPLLDRHQPVQPTTLTREMSRNPELYTDLLVSVSRGDDESVSTSSPSDLEMLRARQLIDGLNRVPGIDDAGVLDESELARWVNEVRHRASEIDRIKSADFSIGRLLARFPNDETHSWPPNAICQVMESVGTEELLRGFYLGVVNGRGMVFRDPASGGDSERALAATFDRIVDDLADHFPRVAAILQEVVSKYQRQADSEDDDAIRFRLNR